MPTVGVVAHAILVATIRPAQKSPLLTVIESWLSTAVSSLAPTVSKTIGFR
jgi:hypothetical protein